MVGAAERAEHRLAEAQDRADEGALEPGGAVGVPHRAVGEDQGSRIRRAGPGHPVALVPRTTDVLDGGQQAAALHFDGGRSFGRRPGRGGGFRGLGEFGDGNEPHPVAGQAAARRRAVEIEQPRRVHPPNQVPAAGGHPRIDPGLRPRHGDGPRRDAHPRGGAPRNVEAGIGHPEVGEAGGEADEEHPVVPLRVDADQLLHRDPDLRRDLGQVLPVIDAGELDPPGRRLGGAGGPAGEVERVEADGFRIGGGVVEHQHRAEGGDRLPEAVERLPVEESREAGGPRVQLGGDLVPELDREGGFAGVPDPRLRRARGSTGHGRPPGSRPQQPVDRVERLSTGDALSTDG